MPTPERSQIPPIPMLSSAQGSDLGLSPVERLMDKAIDALNKQTEAQVQATKVAAAVERERIKADVERTREVVKLFLVLFGMAAVIAIAVIAAGHATDGVGLFRELFTAGLAAIGLVRHGGRAHAARAGARHAADEFPYTPPIPSGPS